MTNLRYQRFWITAMLFLAMLFGIGGLPAYAAACAGGAIGAGAPESGQLPQAAATCPASRKQDCHCCGPQAHPGAVKMACGHSHGGSMGLHMSPGCGCSYQAPGGVPPATTRSGVVVNPPPAVLLPVVVIHLPRASVSDETPAADDEPPPTNAGSTAPSRAPPAL